MKSTSIVDLQYADDCDIAAHTEADLQNTLDAFSEAYKRLGLTVNVTKTKVIFQPAQPLTATAPTIDSEGTTLENVDHFAYRGSYLSKSANIDVEIQHRIRCACFSYGRLKDRVFSERGFRTATKILLYKAVNLTTLLYGCETWVDYRRHVKVLEQFQQRILRAILSVHWQDRITNARILEQAEITSIETHCQVTAELGRTCQTHARYPSTETATVRRAFIREAENWRTVETLQRPTESQPEEVLDGHPMGNHSRGPSLLATYIANGSCKP